MPALPGEDAPSWAFCVDVKEQIWKKVAESEMSEYQRGLPADDRIGFESLLLQLCTDWHPRVELGLKLGQEPRKEKAFRKKWPNFEHNFAQYLKSGYMLSSFTKVQTRRQAFTGRCTAPR